MARELPNRRTIRMRGYDYAQEGAYYVTICTDARRHWFGRIADAVMHRTPIGELAQKCWDAIPEHMPHVDIGEFVVMPNHVHGIVVIRERLVSVGSDHDGPDTEPMPKPGSDTPPKRPMPIVPHGSLGRIMRAYKSAVTRIAYRDGLLPRGTRLWQHNYWDRIIRHDAEHQRIVDYIRDNPKKWKGDRFNG